jgi:hypothetical protein
MLWYSGFWEPGAAVYRRHRPWLVVMSLMAAAQTLLLLLTNPLPSFAQVTHLDLSAALSFRGAPILFLLYPPYILACIGMSLEALLRPGPTVRVMGQLARQQARPG